MGPPTLVSIEKQDTNEAAPPLPTSLAGLIDEILHVQQQRAHAYNAFHSGFMAYLENGAEGPYRALMAGLTSHFQLLSQRALAVETVLRQLYVTSKSAGTAADIVRVVQNAERRKLELTLALQAIRAAMHQERFSWQHGDQGAIGGAVMGCSHVHHGGDSACSSTAAAAAAASSSHLLPKEPSENGIKDATKESYQELEICVTEINDAIAELQELRAELLLDDEQN